MSEDRPLEHYGLRPAQETFLEAYLQTGDMEHSALQAQRKLSTCRGWLKDPKFQQAMQRELQQRLNNGAIGALSTLIGLANDPEVDSKIRLQASKDLLDRAGYKPEHLHTTADKRMESASVQDMIGRIKELQEELGFKNAKTIEHVPQETNSGETQSSELPPPPTPDTPDPLEPGESEAPKQEETPVSGSGSGSGGGDDPLGDVDFSDMDIDDIFG